MKKTIVLILTALLIVIMIPSVALAATSPQYTTEALQLQTLGLFKGTSVGFELERAPARIETLVMLIRILGKEKEALSTTDTNPFTDVPAWAEKYAAYAYANGITTGIGNNKFGSNDIANSAQYLTFILRALGYSDKTGDFTYDKAYLKAAEIGLIESGTYTNSKSTFLRDNCAKISFDALSVKLKGSNQTLIEKLISDSAVSEMSAAKAGFEADGYISLTMNYNPPKDGYELYELSLTEIQKHIPTASWVYNDYGNFVSGLSDREVLERGNAVTDYVRYGAFKPVGKEVNFYIGSVGEEDGLTTIHDTNGNILAYGIYKKGNGTTLLLKKVNYSIQEIANAVSQNVDTIMKNYVDVPYSVVSVGVEKREYFNEIDGVKQIASINAYYLKIDSNKLPASVQDYKYIDCGSISDGSPRLIATWMKYPLFEYQRANMIVRNNTGLYDSAPSQIYMEGSMTTYMSFFDEDYNLLGCIVFSSPSSQTFEMPTIPASK